MTVKNEIFLPDDVKSCVKPNRNGEPFFGTSVAVGESYNPSTPSAKDDFLGGMVLHLQGMRLHATVFRPWNNITTTAPQKSLPAMRSDA